MSLVDVATYRRISGDTTSLDSDVTPALDDAERTVNDHCHRTLAYGTYTETLYVAQNGYCYPKATPIEAVTSPTVSGVAIRGVGVYLGYFNPAPVIDFGGWNSSFPPTVTLTYSGGWQPVGTVNGVTPVLPVALQRAICQIARQALNPVVLTNVPAGVKSVSIGDASLSGDLSALATMDAQTLRDLRGYIRRQVHP